MRALTIDRRTACVWLYCVAVLVVGLVAAWFAARLPAPSNQPTQIPWWVLAIAFAATERFVVDLDVRKQAQTLAFTEAPLILGLILGSPRDVIIVRVAVGIGAIIVFRRSAVVKVIFNAGLFALQTAAAVAVFTFVLGDGIAVEPRGWLAGFLASGAFFLTSAVLVIGVMLLVSSEASVRSQSVVLGIGFAAALAGTAAALASASAVWNDGRSWILLVPICAAIGYFGLAYIRIRERHQALAHLNSFTTDLAVDRGMDELVSCIVAGTAELLNASRSVLVLRDGDDAVFYEQTSDDRISTESRAVSAGEWATALSVVRGTGVGWPHGMPVLGITLDDTNVIVKEIPLADSSGLIVIDGRRSAARRFDNEDVQLLETAVGHAAAGLLNAQLVQKLRDEAAFRAHQALHDDVTDLPNQRALLEQLEGQLALGTRLVMLTARIHSLREVNETLGRAMGDEMLRQVAARLRPIGRRSWCARSGTDEFTLVVPGGQDESDELAEKLVEAFDQPVLCNEVALAVTVGVGVALAPQHGTEADLLLRRASLAASRSALDGTSVTTWASDRDPYDPQSLTIAADLRDAIPDGELEVHFQPQLDIATGQIVSAEALVRWNHPRLGDLRPDQFIPAAENTGAIDALTFHVLEVAATTGARWHRKGWGLDIAVNLSARNLTSARFTNEVAAILDRTGFPAESLTLELTESSVMTEAERALATLHELHALGIALSIDDFGTGYSSLAHLRRLPVGEIKVDKSFVFDLTTSESDEAIVRSMIDLGHNLGLSVVVEGVETVEVRNRLEELHSDRLQGYLLSRPLSATALEAWLAERPVRALVPDSTIGRVVNLDRRR